MRWINGLLFFPKLHSINPFFSLQHIYLELRVSAATGARFSKAPETFRAGKVIAKSRTLHLTDLARFLTIELGS